MIKDPSTYCWGKTPKQRSNYIAPFCTKSSECVAKGCDKCLMLNGKRTGFKRK